MSIQCHTQLSLTAQRGPEAQKLIVRPIMTCWKYIDSIGALNQTAKIAPQQDKEQVISAIHMQLKL